LPLQPGVEVVFYDDVS